MRRIRRPTALHPVAVLDARVHWEGLVPNILCKVLFKIAKGLVHVCGSVMGIYTGCLKRDYGVGARLLG